MTTKKFIKVLSKSSINLYLQCPYKWKCIYLDGIKSLPSPAQQRGIDIHSKIENFYKNIKVTGEKFLIKNDDEDLKKFIDNENNRIIEIIKQNKSLKTYFKPIFQELKLQNDKIGLKGIIDAVFINPDDDKLIVIDWKTGNFNKKDLDKYRLELVVYKLLLEHSDITDVEVGYWGIYFTDKNKLFFEPVSQEAENETLNKISEVRRNIEMKSFHPKKNFFCKWCQFKDKCDKENKWN